MCFCWPSTCWHRFSRLSPDLSSFLLSPQPDELEGVHTHTFKLKPFKKAKSCDICKQAITKEGLICKGECLGTSAAAGSSTANVSRREIRSGDLWPDSGRVKFLGRMRERFIHEYVLLIPVEDGWRVWGLSQHASG